MNAFFKKLKSKTGESLIESLCAILIFTMASVVLFSLVSAAADINGKAKTKDRENQQHMVAVESANDSAKNGSAKFVFTLQKNNRTIPVAEVTADIYGGKDGSLYAYYVKPAGN